MMKNGFSHDVFMLFCMFSLVSGANLPVVLWHGMGASSGTAGGTSVIKKIIEDNIGSYVLSISTGKDAEEVYSGFFGNITAQVDSACQVISAKDELQDGYNALGLSQGGLFLRALAERCDGGPRMHTLVTLGAPHQGVINIPTCTSLPRSWSWSPVYWLCRSMQKALEFGAYLPWVQNSVIQAQYYRDPDNEDKYLKESIFLPAINNEGPVKNEEYKRNLASLARLVLFRFSNDITVVPRNSAWFAKIENGREVKLEETDLYKEDFIGLRHLETGYKLEFGELEGHHMQFSKKDLVDKIILPYFKTQCTDDECREVVA